MAEGHSITEPTQRQREIAAAYQSGMNRDDTMRNFRCTRPVFLESLAACGVPLRHPGWPADKNPRLMPLAFYEKLVADYLAGNTMMEVARINNCSTRPLRYALRKRGIKHRHRQYVPPGPFPPHIDRQRFGDWLSGFVDGEGCFLAAWHWKSRMPIPAVSFCIGLRDDDKEILSLVQSYLACGRLYTDLTSTRDGSLNRKPRCNFRVDALPHLALRVVSHFDQHPLRAKKARDFQIWREAVLLCHQVIQRPRHSGASGERKWKPQEIKHFEKLYTALKRQREYASPDLKS